MEITWQAEDGYAGGNRPHHTTVPDDELVDCETTEDRVKLITDYIQEDFEQNVSWSCRGLEENVAKWEREHAKEIAQ